jgi:hypothetical protein
LKSKLFPISGSESGLTPARKSTAMLSVATLPLRPNGNVSAYLQVMNYQFRLSRSGSPTATGPGGCLPAAPRPATGAAAAGQQLPAATSSLPYAGLSACWPGVTDTRADSTEGAGAGGRSAGTVTVLVTAIA